MKRKKCRTNRPTLERCSDFSRGSRSTRRTAHAQTGRRTTEAALAPAHPEGRRSCGAGSATQGRAHRHAERREGKPQQLRCAARGGFRHSRRDHRGRGYGQCRRTHAGCGGRNQRAPFRIGGGAMKATMPEHAKVSKAENRLLYRSESAPKDKRVEKYLLTFFRKVSMRDKTRILLLANSLALSRIRRKLEQRKARRKGAV